MSTQRFAQSHQLVTAIASTRDKGETLHLEVLRMDVECIGYMGGISDGTPDQFLAMDNDLIGHPNFSGLAVYAERSDRG